MNNQQKIITGLLALGLGLGCGGQTETKGEAKAPEPTVTRQKIGNISAVDLAVCFPKAPALPAKINTSVLTGLLVAARPAVMECLVDPKNRGPEDGTEFTIETTLTGGKLTHKVTGTNTTPDGEKCIAAGVDKFVATAPDWAAKAAATPGTVTAKAPFQHSAANMPSVKMGMSEGSDATGLIRIAEISFCDCYEPWKEAEPAVLKASVKLKKAGGNSIAFDAQTDPAATQVATCLQPKVSALPMKTTSDELTVPFTFSFANSSGTGMYAKADPPMAFMQYEAVRTQYFGASLVADGGRVVAAEAYGALGQQYKKDTKSVTIKQLQDSCGALLTAHDVYIAALEKQLALEEKAITMLTEFAGKDAGWAPVKEGTEKHAAQSKKDIESAKAVRAEDSATCDKLKI